MRTVVVEVLGGVIQDVYAGDGTRIVVVDWDDFEANPSDGWVGEIKPHALVAMPDAAERFIGSLP